MGNPMKFRSEIELENIRNSWSMNEHGILIWSRNANGGKRIGDPVGLTTLQSGHQNCYLTINSKQFGYSLGQVAWFLYYKEWPTKEVDHIDTNPQNNKKINLRLATRSQQLTNRKAGIAGRKNKGVYKRNYGDKWYAQIWVKGICESLGTYDSEEEAVCARINAMSRLQGEYANTQSYGSNE